MNIITYNKQKNNILVSTDWNECLSPSRPFDPLIFKYPELRGELKEIFLKYTGNQISYKKALDEIKNIMPGPISEQDMDEYLTKNFSIYPGALEFIHWCMDNGIVFMINTTGWIGYFQRAIKLDLLPKIEFISASPFVTYLDKNQDCNFFYLYDTPDKARNTEKLVRRFDIKHIFLIGDSGGDGPHFEWGYKNHCTLIGCMAKPSLKAYCKGRDIDIDYFIGNPEEEFPKIEVDKLINIIKVNS